ncbi:MAG: hypothetical protein AB1730_21835 [Myxococcota bacterium]
MRYHLEGVGRDEVPAYLTHPLRLAGTELPLFETSAIGAVFHAVSGLPRKLNLLAHHALTAAASSGSSRRPSSRPCTSSRTWQPGRRRARPRRWPGYRWSMHRAHPRRLMPPSCRQLPLL